MSWHRSSAWYLCARGDECTEPPTLRRGSRVTRQCCFAVASLAVYQLVVPHCPAFVSADLSRRLSQAVCCGGVGSWAATSSSRAAIFGRTRLAASVDSVGPARLAALKRLPKAELKKLLADKGLDVQGSKAVLVSRLAESESRQPEPASAVAPLPRDSKTQDRAADVVDPDADVEARARERLAVILAEIAEERSAIAHDGDEPDQPDSGYLENLLRLPDELREALEGNSPALKRFNIDNVRKGEVFTGVVLKALRTVAFVDFGATADGVVPLTMIPGGENAGIGTKQVVDVYQEVTVWVKKWRRKNMVMSMEPRRAPSKSRPDKAHVEKRRSRRGAW